MDAGEKSFFTRIFSFSNNVLRNRYLQVRSNSGLCLTGSSRLEDWHRQTKIERVKVFVYERVENITGKEENAV